MSGFLLELAGIGKNYPGVVALDDVSLAVGRGEVVGLIGENGAGKSTLMKVLGGLVEPSRGVIRLEGREHNALTVSEAIAGGIAFVHQELNLFDNLDASANMLLGREPLWGGPLRLIDRRAIRRQAQKLLDRLGVDFGPDAPVAGLSLAQRQLLEIAKGLSLDARVVIMDEPTSALTLTETERLLTVIDELKSSGVSVIFISHRLNEVKSCADRVVALRDGRVVGELRKQDIDAPAMIRLMIGRDLKSLYIPPRTVPGEVIFEAVSLSTSTYAGTSVNLGLRRGEILGLAGLVGSGRTELARVMFGVDVPAAGFLRLDGATIQLRSPHDAIERGIYLVPEDRKLLSLLLDVPVAQNISLPDLKSYSMHSILRLRAEAENAEHQRQRLGIRTPSVATPVGSLSGGNQQKVVLAKWLSMRPRVMVFDEPTRGVDVGAKSEIYELMRELADAGVAILMISSDMEEVIGVSDRIAVMHEGMISGFLDRDAFSEHNVLQLAVGESILAPA